MTRKDQIATQMIEDDDGCLGVCINPDSKFNGWLFYRCNGRWVTKRMALPYEIERAHKKLTQLIAEDNT